MLTEVSRQLLHRQAQLEKFSYSWVPQVATGLPELRFHGVVGSFVFPRAHHAAHSLQGFAIEAERFPDLARRGTPFISDHVCGHRRAQFSITLIQILDRLLAI